ncbi:uncharacterized protein LOC110761530 [Prunus avium]|uniref:Uncharacterized protein LOC110761530 n=1 Tax=Prunus avium TaxID=42229 RepID=A0A6P5SS95_PRUAV|nr:uncharacterized protein LOC110761530 [Prunus avium]
MDNSRQSPGNESAVNESANDSTPSSTNSSAPRLTSKVWSLFERVTKIEKGGRVVSEKRARLSPNTIEALICLKDWTLANSRMQDVAQEEQSAEELMNIRATRPDWMTSSGDGEVDSESENEIIGS